MIKIKIAGVPEHFMVPLHQGVASGKFHESHLDVQMVTAHGGSGEMIKWLEDGTVDVAVALTEALVASAAKGNLCHKVVGSYVASPLHWAVSISPKKAKYFKKLDDLWSSECNIAISRFGSGSHVMAVVLQEQLKEKTGNMSGKFGFEVGNNMQGMVDLVNSGSSSALVRAFPQMC
jgi:sulfonate transport system substrate-binding protein